MAELAAGAVNSLLSVIRNEALLLGGVQNDVQFIKEEMESMNSFLTHLARSARHGGEHDEQVRTWMNQVRMLAQDCNNCIDLYLYRGNPEVQRARGRIRRYLWWAYWFVHKLVAQHQAATQLCELKERARDVGQRRLRYGVEIPGAKSAAAASAAEWSSSHEAGRSSYWPQLAGDDEEDDDDQPIAPYHSGRRAYFQPPTLDSYVQKKLPNWRDNQIPAQDIETFSMAIMVPDIHTRLDGPEIQSNNRITDVLELAKQTLVVHPRWNCNRCVYNDDVTVDISAVHLPSLPLRPMDVLYYILHQLKLKLKHSPMDKKKDPDSLEGHSPMDKKNDPDSLEVMLRQIKIHLKKNKVFCMIAKNIEEMKVLEKLEQIKKNIIQDLQKQKGKQEVKQNKGDELRLEELLQLAIRRSSDIIQQDQFKNKQALDNNSIDKIAKMLEKRMQEDEKGKLKDWRQIGTQLRQDQYKRILRKVFPEITNSIHEQQPRYATKQATRKPLDEDRVKQMIHQAKEEILQDLKEGKYDKNQETSKGKDNNDQETGQCRAPDQNLEENSRDLKEGKYDKNQEIGKGKDNNDRETGQCHAPDQSLDENSRDLKEGKYGKNQETGKGKENNDRETGQCRAPDQNLDENSRDLKEGKYDKNQETGESKDNNDQETGQCRALDQNLDENSFPIAEQGSGTLLLENLDEVSKQVNEKMDRIKALFIEQLEIKWLIDEIKHLLKEEREEGEYYEKYKCPLFIIKHGETMDASTWEDTRKALSLLELSADALIVTTTTETQQAKRYCYLPLEPIEYSLTGLYHYTVFNYTSSREHHYDPQIVRNILEECEPHEFCMRIFTHALCINPRRSNEELDKLYDTLQDSPKSFDAIAKKMFKFTYNDLPKEYKSCLLYLSIFPQGHRMKRSTLIGRWVAEGFIFKEDWIGSMSEANKCFNMLINRWLVYPDDIGATGKVKSCVVGDIIHGFIAKIAKKQHILEPRLSHHLARHFSIFNDLHLRSSEGIGTFFQRLSKLSQVSRLKVLDLEGCHCFGGNNQRYLKEICRKMLLLKYLSLRGTDITQLPREINHLRELQFLDIRQTKVPEDATRHVLLLKLKHLLAGHIDSSSSDNGTAIRPNNISASSVHIPHKIGKMVNLEVLSNVKVQNSHDLKDIGKLCYLRKLGVVINDNRDLEKLHREISDLHECLLSLSISITTAQEVPHCGAIHKCLHSLPISCTQDCTRSSAELTNTACDQNHPKNLERLSIRGGENILSWFSKSDKLAKVTLCSTSLNIDNLMVLAKLPNLHCVQLRHITCPESKLIIKKEDFKCLKSLLVEGPNFTEIKFEEEAACELEAIVLSSTSIESVFGVRGLQKLEEMELRNNKNNSKLLSLFEDAKQLAILTLHGTLLDEGAIKILAKKSNMRCLVLLDKSCERRKITFEKGDFPKLNHLTVRSPTITCIDFADGSAPKIEKIVWSSSTSLSGINRLPRLKELVFHGDSVPDAVKKAKEEHKNKPTLRHNKEETDQNQAKENKQEDKSKAATFPFCWKNKL